MGIYPAVILKSFLNVEVNLNLSWTSGTLRLLGIWEAPCNQSDLHAAWARAAFPHRTCLCWQTAARREGLWWRAEGEQTALGQPDETQDYASNVSCPSPPVASRCVPRSPRGWSVLAPKLALALAPECILGNSAVCFQFDRLLREMNLQFSQYSYTPGMLTC